MYCIYHSADLDGFTSAAIVKKAFPEAILIGHNYGDSTEKIDAIPDGSEIVIVDVTVETPHEKDPIKKMQKMFDLSKRSKKLIWIDHHLSAINTYMQFKDEFNEGKEFCEGYLEVGPAACELTWRYFFPEDTMPMAVDVLGSYDVWRKRYEKTWDELIFPFQMGMRLVCNSPSSFPVTLLEISSDSRSLFGTILQDGHVIVAYQNSINAKLCSDIAFEAEIEGLRAICLNQASSNSIAFDSVFNPEKHDVMVPFSHNGKYWRVSIYTTSPDIDCSAIARKLGGGGHKMAAGFETEDIFKILKTV